MLPPLVIGASQERVIQSVLTESILQLGCAVSTANSLETAPLSHHSAVVSRNSRSAMMSVLSDTSKPNK